MKSSKVLMMFVLLAGGVAAAQDIPNFAPHAMRRYQVAGPAQAPEFSNTTFRADEFHAFQTPSRFRFEPPAAPRSSARSFPMLKTFQRNRLVATLAGSVPALARAFDDDAPAQRRISVGPLIDIDDARVGVRVRIRFGN
ncbi:MAG TPA: hypothetical protein VLA96_07955 [Terriglobales bacterium]|nr:hypothetical protein [Terriglobales bacterium]